MGLAFPVATEACFAARNWTGVELLFTPGFSAQQTADVKVYSKDPVTFAQTLLLEGAHYTVTLGVDGAVTVLPVALPAAPKTILIVRDTPALQPVDFTNLNTYAPPVHTTLHSQAALRDAEDKFFRTRALRAPLGETIAELPNLPARIGSAGGTLAGYDGSGNPTALEYTLPNLVILASQAEAEAGVNNTHVMSPLRTRQAIFATQPVIDARWFGATGTDTDDTAALQAAIAYAEGTDKAAVIQLGRDHRITATLLVSKPNVRLRGYGGGMTHDGGPGITYSTILRWYGAAGGTMVRFKTPFGVGASKISGVGIEGVFLLGRQLAANGLEVNTVSHGIFKNCHVEECTGVHYLITCGISSVDIAEAADTQDCLFDNLSGRAGDAAPNFAAVIFKLTGSSNANVSFNELRNCWARHKDGPGFLLENCDNNIFYLPRVIRVGGTAYNIDISGATAGGLVGGEANTFIGPSWGAPTAGCRIRGTEAGFIAAATLNSFIDIDNANGSQIPELGTGADWQGNLRGLFGYQRTLRYVNAQTGTSYAIKGTDWGRTITFNNASPIAVSIGAPVGLFQHGFWVDIENIGAGTVTVTPSGALINGAASQAFTAGRGGRIYSDGVNYRTSRDNLLSVLATDIGVTVQAFDADLSALAALSGTGIAVRSAANTWVQRALANAAAGLTWTNGDGVAGNPTPVFANDLGALEALTGSGFAERTGVDTWAITGFTGTGNVARATSPTFVTPTLGAALATSLGVGGALVGSSILSAQGNGNAGVITSKQNDGGSSAAGAGGFDAITDVVEILFLANGSARTTARWSLSAVGGWAEFFSLDNGGAHNGMVIGVFNNKPLVLGQNNLERARVQAGFSVGTTSDPGAGMIYTNAATFMIRTKTSYSNGAGAATGTLTNAPAATNPTKWIPVDDNGTTRHVPAW